MLHSSMKLYRCMMQFMMKRPAGAVLQGGRRPPVFCEMRQIRVQIFVQFAEGGKRENSL